MRIDMQVPWEMERRIRALLKKRRFKGLEREDVVEYLAWRGLYAIQHPVVRYDIHTCSAGGNCERCGR